MFPYQTHAEGILNLHMQVELMLQGQEPFQLSSKSGVLGDGCHFTQFADAFVVSPIKEYSVAYYLL